MALDVSVSTRDGEILLPVQQRPAPPCAIVIFGASGDLTHRKLIPALFDLFRASRQRGFFGRQIGFLNSGVYRQTLLDNLGLIVAVWTRKI